MNKYILITSPIPHIYGGGYLDLNKHKGANPLWNL